MKKGSLLISLIIAMILGIAQVSAQETDTEEKTKESSAKEAENEEEEEDGETFRRPFAGTTVYWSNEFTAISLDRSHDYTYNPVYSMGFGVKPIWIIVESFSLSTRIGFATELTNSDFANRRGEVFFYDIPVMVNYDHSVDINEDVMFGTGLSVSLLMPTSKLSRYATLYTALGIGTSAVFTFPHVLKGLVIGWSPTFRKNFHASENAYKEGNPLDESGIPESEKLTSTTYQSLLYASGENPSWSIANSIKISLSLVERLSLSFIYTHNYTYLYSPTNTGAPDEESCSILPNGCDPIHDTGHNEQGIYTHAFRYSLDCKLPEPLNMLTASLGAVTASNQLGAVTASNQLGPDGSYRTPFFNRESMITFGLSLNIDAAVSAIAGDDEGKEK